MGYAARAGFGALWTDVIAKVAQAKATPTPTTVAAPLPPLVYGGPAPIVPPPPGTMPPPQPMPPVIQPILVAGPAPSPSGGGGGGGVDAGLAPAAGGTGVSNLLQQPAVLIGIAILGFLALRRGGGTRRW